MSNRTTEPVCRGWQNYREVMSDAYLLSDSLYTLQDALKEYIFDEFWTDPEESDEDSASIQETASEALAYAQKFGDEVESVGWLVTDVVNTLVKLREKAYNSWKEESEDMDQDEWQTNRNIAEENARAVGKRYWDEQVVPLYDALLDDVIAWLDHVANGVPKKGYDYLPHNQLQLILDRDEKMKKGTLQ